MVAEVWQVSGGFLHLSGRYLFINMLKTKTCKMCKVKFEPRSTTQLVCSFQCSMRYLDYLSKRRDAKQKQIDFRAYREAKEAIKPLKYWADKAQTAFNRYIVARDGKVCISCGTQKPDIQYCAGHYRTRKAAGQLRYNEDNVHTQCNKHCNMMLSGNIENYRPALIAKIGQERHDALINNHETKRWTREECQEIEKLYKQKLKDIK